MNTQTVHDVEDAHTFAPSDLPLPYRPRALTRAELKRKDVYAFLSPKLRREVWVTGALSFATSLQFEFDIEIAAYCERPRKLMLPDSLVEVAFWTRHPTGSERIWLLVPTIESEPAAGGQRRYKREDQALETAEQAHPHLRFLFETDLIASGTSIGVWFALLPYVQTAHVMDNYVAVEARVHGHFRFTKAATFKQIETALSDYSPHDVRSTVCRAIHEGWLQIDTKHPLHVHTVVERGVRYEN